MDLGGFQEVSGGFQVVFRLQVVFRRIQVDLGGFQVDLDGLEDRAAVLPLSAALTQRASGLCIFTMYEG